MKRVIFVLALAIGIGAVMLPSTTYAQKMSKKEKKKQKKLKKQWKKKARNYVKNPLSLQKMIDSYEKKIADKTAELDEANRALNQCNSKTDSLTLELNSKIKELENLNMQYEQLAKALENAKNMQQNDITAGLIFKVQIGAFQYFDMNKYLSETKNFEGESADNLNKYTLGKFRDYDMASTFKKDIRKMGIRDAWVVPYMDGVRITMTEAKKYMMNQGSGSGESSGSGE